MACYSVADLCLLAAIAAAVFYVCLIRPNL